MTAFLKMTLTLAIGMALVALVGNRVKAMEIPVIKTPGFCQIHFLHEGVIVQSTPANKENPSLHDCARQARVALQLSEGEFDSATVNYVSSVGKISNLKLVKKTE